MRKSLIEQEWFLLGQPWCHSEEAGMDIYAGDCDPHAGTYLFSTQVIEDDGHDEEESKEIARDIAEHILELHNRSLNEANKPTNLWLDKLRSEQRRVEELRSQLTQSQAELAEAKQKFADEVIALITTEQTAMSRLYSKHTYGINKVCNRLKLFVGDLISGGRS